MNKTIIAIEAWVLINFFGYSKSGAYRLISEMRKRYNKPKPMKISLYDFADYTGLPIEEIRRAVA